MQSNIIANSTERKQQWWSSFTDECPITLEPLSSLPYPPFILTDNSQSASASASSSASEGIKSCKNYYFDGLALATYIVSQGTFTNPLTREPLSYDDCIRMDDYLTEHIYDTSHNNNTHHALSPTQDQEHYLSVLGAGRREQNICVKEAWLLRDSIKVKVEGSDDDGGHRSQQRADALRNEAAAALRGLFVFGHHHTRSRNRSGHNGNDWSALGDNSESRSSSSLPSAPGGFNLHHNPDSNSTSQQEGLRIIDDDEAAFEAADAAAWRDVQEAFPTLPYSNGDNTTVLQQQLVHSENNDNNSYHNQQLLETVRQTAQLTTEGENQKAEILKRNRQRYFQQALERKKDRIETLRKAKEEAASTLSREKEAEDVLRSAREEIDQWRAQQWDRWERNAFIRGSKTNTKDSVSPDIHKLPPVADTTASQNQAPTAEEKAAKAAAKKKAKRQKAKERAKEKKRLEKLDAETKERALALEREKEDSKMKCGACGEGILGCGFEKYGMSFCSTKCARNGPSKKD